MAAEAAAKWCALFRVHSVWGAIVTNFDRYCFLVHFKWLFVIYVGLISKRNGLFPYIRVFVDKHCMSPRTRNPLAIIHDFQKLRRAYGQFTQHQIPLKLSLGLAGIRYNMHSMIMGL